MDAYVFYGVSLVLVLLLAFGVVAFKNSSGGAAIGIGFLFVLGPFMAAMGYWCATILAHFFEVSKLWALPGVLFPVAVYYILPYINFDRFFGGSR